MSHPITRPVTVMPNNNTNNKRRKYRRTCNDITRDTNNKIGKSEIRGYAIWYLDNVSKNNGKCKYGFLAGLVREASSNNNALQIYKTDIQNEARRIVAKQRKLSQQLSGATKTSTIINEPLDIDDPQVNELDVDDPRVDDLQLSVGTNILDNAVHNIHPPPLPAGGEVEVNETSADTNILDNTVDNPRPPPLPPGGEVEVNETSVLTTDDYFLYRMGVTIPKTVTHVQFHSSVKCVQPISSLHHELFGSCRALVKVVLNNGLQKIGAWAFECCTSLRNIIIPSSVTLIGDWAFSNCVSLETVVLNNGLQRIGDSAFHNCTSLRHIIIPPSVTTIERHLLDA
jgi:hypothetical protein